MNNFIEYLNEINDKKMILYTLLWEIDTVIDDTYSSYNIEVASKLETEIFLMSTSSKYITLLDEYINSDEFKELEDFKKKYYLSLKECYEKEKRIPEDFYNDFCIQKNISKKVWAKAKKEKNYKLFEPYLIKNINMTKELYRYIYPNSNNLYDDMLNDYERGLKQKDIDPLFEELKKEIIPLVKNLKDKELEPININLSESKLYEISKFLLDYIGFDNKRGSLGIYPHGYTTKVSKNDVRIAFSKTNNLFDLSSTIIHEGGHGIFELYSEKEFNELNRVDVDLIALHESQSRFYENILGRNINFWIPIYEKFKKISGIDLSIDEFIKYFNNPKASFIRTEADELTYCLHIIIRYEIEKEIFNGNIDLNKLDEVWNNKYKEYLGLDVKEDDLGILQDMHWSDASFGYFPSYLLGSIFDGMLLEEINKEVGNVDELLKQGKIKEITKYLNTNIHKYANAYNIFETCKRVCKKDMNVMPLVNYFKKKYEE